MFHYLLQLATGAGWSAKQGAVQLSFAQALSKKQAEAMAQAERPHGEYLRGSSCWDFATV